MYKIIFNDNSTFVGGEPDNSKWNSMPNKPIKELHYDLLGKKIVLKNYEAYNHLIKSAFILSSQQQVIVAIIIMVKINTSVKKFIFDLIENKLFLDDVIFGMEYNNKPTSGWKVGLSNSKYEFKIN